jgi:(5-formylfuran-3-yl)methyl phosphate synthase
MQQTSRPVSFLASVTDESEARLCVALGADVIDAKNPAEGALGALPLETVRAIRANVPAHVPVSATIGDPASDPEATVDAVFRVAATGIDIVKVGLSPESCPELTLRRLSRLARGPARLVAVLLADRGIDLALIGAARDAGFAGVMLDTGDKRKGALPGLVSGEVLREFVETAHDARLFAGFAGSLSAGDIAYLTAFGPDLLGFRGGLCRDGERNGALHADAVRAVRRAIPKLEAASIVPCRATLHDGIARQQRERAL